jgi:hypothetical protein
VPLTPCANTTDTFATLDATKWAFSNATSGMGDLVLSPLGSTGPALAKLKATQTLDECFTTVKVTNQENGTTARMIILDTTNVLNREEVGYDQSAGNILVDMSATGAAAQPDYLGIALHGGHVYFFYAHSTTWTFVTKVARPAWMDGTTDAPTIRCDALTGKTCRFDDFNVKPLVLADLPP